jgi:hypothetical protein
MNQTRLGVPLFIGTDDGPRQTLESLAKHLRVQLEDTAPKTAQNEDYWAHILSERRAQLLFCGTSDSLRGREIEASARCAAARAGIPIVAIEDFPGNYRDVESAQADILVVESELVEQFTRDKLGLRCPAVVVVSPPRYDQYRQKSRALRDRVNVAWRARSRQKTIVLWAGQPETTDSIATLQALVPVLQAQHAELLFKAHPRDPGYRAGAYAPVLAGLPWRDVTQLSVSDALALAPQLVVTQFSSVAVEAGFFGIPSLSVLLDDAGGTRLMEKKGYAVPPYCLCGATAFVTREAEIASAFMKMLTDPVARGHTLGCFDDYFQNSSGTLPKLIAALEKHFEKRGFSF